MRLRAALPFAAAAAARPSKASPVAQAAPAAGRTPAPVAVLAEPRRSAPQPPCPEGNPHPNPSPTASASARAAKRRAADAGGSPGPAATGENANSAGMAGGRAAKRRALDAGGSPGSPGGFPRAASAGRPPLPGLFAGASLPGAVSPQPARDGSAKGSAEVSSGLIADSKQAGNPASKPAPGRESTGRPAGGRAPKQPLKSRARALLAGGERTGWETAGGDGDVGVPVGGPGRERPPSHEPLGCPKCRYAAGGCGRCRSASARPPSARPPLARPASGPAVWERGATAAAVGTGAGAGGSKRRAASAGTR